MALECLLSPSPQPRASWITLILLLASMGSSPSQARTWYVTPDGSGDAPTVQAAIDSAAAGDEVVLAPGVYSWTSQGASGESMITMRRSITLRGEGGAEATVIDAELRGRAVRCFDVGAARIEALTVTRGFFDRRIPDGIGWGSGIYSTGSSRPTITGCIVRDNHSLSGNFGAGIACVDMGATVTNTHFIENEAAYGSQGAGIYIVGGLVSNCLFRGNRSIGDGALGAGMRAVNSVIENCSFESNRCISISGATGAAIMAVGGEIRGCTFIGNEASAEVLGNVHGGAVWCLAEDVRISSCVFAGNRAVSVGYPGVGGAISASSSRPTITNCTFLSNAATFLYPLGPGIPVGGLYLPDGGEVRACIIAWTDGAPCSGPATMTCNVFYQNSLEDPSCATGGGSNIVADPQFCAADPVATRNLSIQSDSPCAPDNPCGLVGARPVGCGTVSINRRDWTDVKRLFR